MNSHDHHLHEKHLKSSDFITDVVIGMSDGLTVPFALAAGLSGAVASASIVTTAGIAEIVAGSIAMGLGGFLAGTTVSGVLMGMFQNNAGGAWDNAKKSFEKGVEINGEMFYKKSEPHKASVTGDTVGDPFKDTSGPSMNILIKLMSIVSLVIAPTLAQLDSNNTPPSLQAPVSQPAGNNKSTKPFGTFILAPKDKC